MIALLREYGGGELKGLSPAFQSAVLYYNEDLFDELRIPYPQNFMSWGEVLELAALFSGHEQNGQPYIGLSRFNVHLQLFQFIHSIAMTDNVSLLSQDHSMVAINSPEWLDLSERAVAAYRSGAIGERDISSEGSIPYTDLYRSFFDGEAGMVIANDSFMKYLGIVDFNWSFVTQPVDSKDRQTALSFNVSEVFGINAASANMEAAWEFIKHVHSERVISA